MAKTEKSDHVVIKKYANRRLYNTEKSSYITLEDLAAMVREGVDFEVVDAKSGADITRSVLAQIIFEEEGKGQNMLPTNFLRQLIRFYGDTLQGFVPGYLESAMTAFADNQEELRNQMSAGLANNPALANFDAIARQNMALFEQTMRMFSPFQTATGEQSAGEGEASREEAQEGRDSEIDGLKDQLAQMQEQLTRLAGDKLG